jgi:predicted TIM-barrel fold metal-dependent hydrolase
VKTEDDYNIEKARQHGRGRSVTFIPEPDREEILCPIVSVDDHALEPPTLFEGRLTRRLQDRAPHLGVGEDGLPWWIIDEVPVPIVMGNGGAGRSMSEWALANATYDEFRAGVWQTAPRLQDMDLVGVWASLCFCSIVWGFAGQRISRMRDPELGLACLQAYNDWMLEEWCGADRLRFIPCQLPWMPDPIQGAKEIHQNAERGFRAVSFSENPEGLGFPNIYDRSWDPFFRACEETETVVNLHVGSQGKIRIPCTSSAEEVSVAIFPISGFEQLVDWIYSGVPVRFPGLRIALSEAGVSWVPMALERLGRAFRQAKGVGKGWPTGAPTPQEVVRRNFVFTSIEDPSAFRLLDLIGEDRVMVEVDYPHFDSTWPYSQDILRSELLHLDRQTIRKVCFGNACRIYRHPEPPAAMLAASAVGSVGFGTVTSPEPAGCPGPPPSTG